MITRRIAVNLVAFGILAVALIAYGFFDLLGNPLASTTTVSTVFPSASGLSPNFLVTLDGVDVGMVKSVALVPGGAKVIMTLNSGTQVPSDVEARVVIANALGEQEVQLVSSPQATSTASASSASGLTSTSAASRTGIADSTLSRATTGDPSDPHSSLRNGAVIPAAANSLPADVGTVVAEATKLLQAVPVGSLDSLLHEAAVALNGNSDNLRTIASASELFSQEFLAQQQQFESLLSNAPPVLDTVTQNAAVLQQDLADTAVLEQVLATHASDLVRLLDEGVSASTALQTLLAQNEPNLACFVHDASDLAANLGSGVNLQNISAALATNQLFFGTIKRVAVTGPAKALNSKDHFRADQEWLRTRLLLPGLDVPLQPTPIAYNTPTTLPAVLPGAGCSTEFGQGVGPVTQAGFHPVGPNAKLVPASAGDSNVRGGGTEPTSAAPAAAELASGASSVVLPTAVGLVALGWFITLGRRRSARSARPLHAAARVGRMRGR